MASTPDFDAILIKVASMGLSKAELGQSVTSLVPKLLRMVLLHFVFSLQTRICVIRSLSLDSTHAVREENMKQQH